MKTVLLFIVVLLMIGGSIQGQSPEVVLLKNVTVIDGSGKPAQRNMSVLIRDGKIGSISKQNNFPNAKVINLAGKTIMPLLTNVHGHLGMSKGTTVGAENFNQDHIIKELERYQSYGVGTVVSMGTDKELIFSIREASRSGKVPGATVYTAGYGFRPPLAGGSTENGMEKIYRPATPEEAIRNVNELVAFKPDMIKIWVDEGGIKPEIYRAIISEAHKHGIRVAAHLYYLEDAHLLLDAGVDIFAHSVRDKEVDDALISKMKAKGTIYIPTLTRDGYEFFYGTTPTWINDPFFKASLEPGVFEMITKEDYKNRIVNNPRYQKNKEAYAMALTNLKKLFDGGVLVVMGTDSGAQPVRAQGFSEHLELQLMVDAGLTPLQAISVATRNSCEALGLKDQGILSAGMRADFVVLNENPEGDIKATQSIYAVWKEGVQVSGAVPK
ncbi:amidohydrolase family protein [Chryseolinea sp. H1M3-3]|uniref:amidohydrolase family protein n=1 Tax=Chryseolinea sp. H1M3-3 TaxID=3034144 RepID=UPI0023ED5FD1|nr:amidohydrolase family protein [Chryseolinea sp. H1M3-3]